MTEATSKLIVRCTPDQKGGYVSAAQKAGKKLEAWVIEALDEKAAKEKAERESKK
ncbi:hypothetical protein QF52_003366 [Salmonella enterica subsp. enterica]|nr:hypothetical protein [Salmonella enterica subsp. enterica]EJI5360003.1 hypothetical protein [Salmonella enterica]